MNSKRDLNVIYIDNHVLAVNKPAGLVTQPSGSSRESLQEIASRFIKLEFNRRGNVFLHPVHRLDRPVSGGVLFARTSKSLSRLNADMRAGKIIKIYHAVTSVCPTAKKNILAHHLRHSRQRAVVTDAADPRGKLARLHYRVSTNSKTYWLLEIRPETGRYHQIRAQLAAIRCPIVGDHKYGGSGRLPHRAIALHQRRLEIVHPTRRTTIRIEADYPDYWPLTP